jgi:hypothetical protein
VPVWTGCRFPFMGDQSVARQRNADTYSPLGVQGRLVVSVTWSLWSCVQQQDCTFIATPLPPPEQLLGEGTKREA